MLGQQPRINQSKRLSELEERVKALTKQVAYVTEMNRLCSQLVHVSSKMLALMDENATNDGSFSDRLAEMNGAVHAKVQQCDAWLIENKPKLDTLTGKLSNRGHGNG